MKKRLFIILFCTILLGLVYQVGFDPENSENVADINDMNDLQWQDPLHPNDVNALTSQMSLWGTDIG